MALLRSRSSQESAQVHRVTSAQEALSQEQSRRTKRYLISMSIRTICFIAVIFTTGWMQWAAIAGAVFLPYLAVIAANAGRENDRFANEPVEPVSSLALPQHAHLVIEPEQPEQGPRR
jgi:hypothetical protein